MGYPLAFLDEMGYDAVAGQRGHAGTRSKDMSETRKAARPQQVAKTLKAAGFELATSHSTAIRGYRVYSRGLVVENSILKDSVWVRRVPQDRLTEVVSILEAAGYEADTNSLDIDVVVR